jgi:hypothetical protein
MQITGDNRGVKPRTHRAFLEVSGSDEEELVCSDERGMISSFFPVTSNKTIPMLYWNNRTNQPLFGKNAEIDPSPSE